MAARCMRKAMHTINMSACGGQLCAATTNGARAIPYRIPYMPTYTTQLTGHPDFWCSMNCRKICFENSKGWQVGVVEMHASVTKIRAVGLGMLSERWRSRFYCKAVKVLSYIYSNILRRDYRVGVRGCASHLTESEYGAVHLVPKGVLVEHNICHQTQSPIRAAHQASWEMGLTERPSYW